MIDTCGSTMLCKVVFLVGCAAAFAGLHEELVFASTRSDVIDVVVDSYDSLSAAAVDAFLTRRVDWSVESEPWSGGRLRLRRAPPGGGGGVLRDLAVLWNETQWGSGGCRGVAQSLGGHNPWGPIVQFWAKNAWQAWSLWMPFVPPSLSRWYLAAPFGSAFCDGAQTHWGCHFLELSACDGLVANETAESQFVRVFSDGRELVCKHGGAKCDKESLVAVGVATANPALDHKLADVFARARGVFPGVTPDRVVLALLQRSIAHRPSWRVRQLMASSGATARRRRVFSGHAQDDDASCAFLQIRHGSKTSPQWLHRHKTASFFVDLPDYLAEAFALLGAAKNVSVLVGTDDADVVDDFRRYPALDLVEAPSVVGAASSEAYWCHDCRAHPTSMNRGVDELARILVTLEIGARCAAFVGNCASSFVRSIDAGLLALRLRPVKSFSFGDRPCLSDASTDKALRRTCDVVCRNETACGAGPGPRTCVPPPPQLRLPPGDYPARFRDRAAALGLDRRHRDSIAVV